MKDTKKGGLLAEIIDAIDDEEIQGYITTVVYKDGIIVTISSFEEELEDETKGRALLSITESLHGK